jgi:hypothetical protein
MATATTNGTKTGTEPAEVSAIVEIDRIAAETLRIPILGTSPLIVHRFSEKAKRQMLDAMQGRKAPKQPKDPQAEYEGAFYRFTEPATGEPLRSGIPVISFKAATVSGARFYRGVTMKELRQFFFVRGELGLDGLQLAEIEGEPHMREDVVTVGRGGTDLRYRPEYTEWRTTLNVTYVTTAITRASMLSLVDAGGLGVGVGEWRPERNGDFGTYRIDPDRKVEIIG